MLYAQTGIHALSAVPGCPGHTYEDRADKSEPRMSVHGCAHETHLRTVKDPLWASTPSAVPLNEHEQKAADEAKAGREKAVYETAAGTAQAIANITQVLAGLVEKVGAPQAPSAVPSAPEATAPAAGAAEPAAEPVKAPRPRKPAAKAGVPA